MALKAKSGEFRREGSFGDGDSRFAGSPRVLTGMMRTGSTLNPEKETAAEIRRLKPKCIFEMGSSNFVFFLNDKIKIFYHRQNVFQVILMMPSSGGDACSAPHPLMLHPAVFCRPARAQGAENEATNLCRLCREPRYDAGSA